jgi:hypothetical protein
MIYRGLGFLAVDHLAPPHRLTLSREQVISISQSSCVSLVELLTGEEGEVVGKEPNHTTARKPGPL